MRWIKHLTLAHADMGLTAISEQFGAEGYGIYWLIVEHIAAPMEAGKLEPVAVHTRVKWASICHCSTRKFSAIVKQMAKKNLIDYRLLDDCIKIAVPKILKYKDEYSKKSGANRDREQIQIEKEKQKEKEQTHTSAKPADGAVGDAAPKTVAIKPPDETADWFDQEFWPDYPRKKGRATALKAALAQLKTAELRAAALRGLRDQVPEWRHRDPTKIPHAATWINGRRWEDEPDLPFTAPAAPGMQRLTQAAQILQRMNQIGAER